MSAIKIIQAFAKKSLTKNQGSGIINLPGAMQSEAKAGEIVALLQRAGIPINQLDDFIRSEADVAKFLNIIEAASKPKVYSGQAAVDQLNKLFPKKGEVVDMTGKTMDTSQGIMGGKSVKELMESGQVQKGTDGLKKNDKVTQRDMFKDSNLNKEGTIMDRITTASNRIKQIQKEQDEMYRPKTDAEIKAKFDKQNKDSVKNIKNNRKLTDEEIRDYELELGDSETWLNKGTFGEAEQALKNKKAYEAKMFAEYKSIGGSKRPDGPNASKKDSLPIRLMKNFEKELNEADLMAEGYSKDQANVLIKARQKMTSGEEMNPNESLLRVKEEFADNAGVDVEDFTDIDFEIDIPDYAKGGRAGFYTGGITDVEPSLDDIGHGADALNARTRLMSPGNQATTSTGLNYLLAEDNDNMRIPFAGGGDPKRRAFLKLLASLTGGAAAFKSGLLSLGEGGTKKAVTETVKQAAGSGGKVPPYFLKLVEKIQKLGDDVTPSYAVKDRQKVTKYKDYELTEDVTTGEKTIQRMKIDDDLKYDASEYYGKPVGEEVYMSYKPGKGQVDETMKGKTPPDEYIEDTSLIRSDRPAEGEIMETFDGVPNDILEEVGETIVKKADGGRIGFSAGKTVLSKLGINSTSRRFLEKVFGKEKFQTMIQNDPRMHRGMLEVVEMFRSKDKEGLKMYLQKFMPNMDDTEIEKFIVGDSGTEGIEGQLIRLGSGREYENLIKMSKEADQIRKLDDFDIDGVSKNAEGGRIGFSGGGIFRAIIAKSAAKKGMSVTDFIKATNYKGLPPEVKMYISADEFAKLKSGQQDLYENFIDMAKTRKSFQENVEAGKKGPASPLFENLEKTMDEQSFVPKTVTSDDIAQMELMVKNRFNKGRKDNAQGGLQTMLGE